MPSRPNREEYGEYFAYYVEQVPEGELTAVLAKQLAQTVEMYAGLTEAQAEYRYAPGKWTVKEVLGHLIDTERIMSYRLLRIARGDQTPLVGFDENAYVAQAFFQKRDLADLLEECQAVRQSTRALLRGVAEEAWTRTGTANGNKLSARTLAYVIAGHEAHHCRILRERYSL
ncbi:DinB family protein [Brevibacillus agri]|uniref:DinB family protein n=1 Tax=Brevibacillus agri TaxID=51101 RepID=UPI0018CCCB11|nr:DinB family protein [Brevibacillus agri]MBG9564975.1 squalene-hopene cyclase [Brevibacillus agri]MBY0053499.1 DinB family protein [Brevibacillus agri]